MTRARHAIKWMVILTLCMGWFSLATGDEILDPAGKVTYFKGKVEVFRNHAWQELILHAKVFQSDILRTGKKSRLEVRLVDQSIIRLGSKSELKITQNHFVKGKERTFSATFARGRFYSMVSKLVSGSSKFEVETSNAVAGVRGTTFRIDANQDRSTLVRVYAGAVAVSNAPVYIKTEKSGSIDTPSTKKPNSVQNVKPDRKGRRVVAGPKEVSKKEWEEYVAKAMQEVRVAAGGKIGKPTGFDPDFDAMDEWVAWNTNRDKQLEK